MSGTGRKSLLLLGATGLVGAAALGKALAHAQVARVVAPVRRPLAPHPRLFAPVVDFADLDGWPDLWGVDAVLCCLGTTIRAAGSQERFVAIDHDLPVEIGRRARAAGAGVFALVSALGADPAARVFYSRVKGETERDVVALGFPSTVIARPNLLDGARTQTRPMERAALALGRALGPVLPRAWRVSRAASVAGASLDAALAARPGVVVIGSAAFA